MNIIKYGTLTRWLIDRNYGFIKEDSGLDVFIHVSGFSDKVAPPQNTRLKFHLAPNPQKPNREMAVDAEVIVPRRIAVQYGEGGERHE